VGSLLSAVQTMTKSSPFALSLSKGFDKLSPNGEWFEVTKHQQASCVFFLTLLLYPYRFPSVPIKLVNKLVNKTSP
jgi:hypothetical protein